MAEIQKKGYAESEISPGESRVGVIPSSPGEVIKWSFWKFE
jgi:hypothetical protein